MTERIADEQGQQLARHARDREAEPARDAEVAGHLRQLQRSAGNRAVAAVVARSRAARLARARTPQPGGPRPAVPRGARRDTDDAQVPAPAPETEEDRRPEPAEPVDGPRVAAGTPPPSPPETPPDEPPEGGGTGGGRGPVSEVLAGLTSLDGAGEGPRRATTSRYRLDETGEAAADETATATGAGAPARDEDVPTAITAEAAQALDGVQAEDGEPAPADAQAAVERETGTGLDGARVHAGPRAAEAAAAVSARALSVGDHVALGAGVDASGAEGQSLVAHELAHVAQDRADRGEDESVEAEEPAPAESGATGAASASSEPPWPFTPGPPPEQVRARRGTTVRRAAINAGADNLGALSEMFDTAVSDARAEVSGAVRANQEAATQALDQTSGQVDTAVASTQGVLSQAYDRQEEAVRSGFADGRTQVEAGTEQLSSGIDEAASSADQEVATAGDTGRTAVEDELRTRADAVEEEGEVADLADEAARQRAAIDASASRIIGQYAGHEEIADIRSGVRSTAAEAKTEVDQAVEGARSEAQGATSQIAEQPRGAVSGQRAEVDRAARTAASTVTDERAEGQQGVSEVRSRTSSELAASESEASDRIASARTASESALGASAADAASTLSRARTEATASLGNFEETTTARLDAWRTAAREEQAAIDEDVGNLFVPGDVGPAVEDLAADAGADEERLDAGTADMTQRAATSAAEFASGLTQAAGAATASLGGVVARGLSSLTGSLSGLTGAIDSAVGELSPGFGGIVNSIGSTIDRMLNRLSASGSEGQAKVHEGIADATKSSRAEIDGAAQRARADMAEVAANAGDTGWFGSFLDGLLGALEWIGKNLVNLLWGFIWGEVAFDDVAGAEIVAFIGDVVAGVLVYGDVRDIVKWAIIKPLIFGEGYTWENALMIGIAAFGLIPVVGDIGKVIGKGSKLAVRLAMKSLKKKLGKELAGRLVKELGEDAAAELGEKLSKEAIETLLDGMDATALKALTDELGGESVERLAAELSGETVKELVEAVGTAGLKGLLDEFSPAVIKRLYDDLGGELLVKVADDPKHFAAVFDDLGLDKIQQLLKHKIHIIDLIRLKNAFGDSFATIALNLGPAHLKQLAKHAAGGEGVAKIVKALMDEAGIDGLKKVLDDLGGQLVFKLNWEVGLSAKEILQLAPLGSRFVWNLVEGASPKTIARVASLMASGSEVRARLLAEVLTNVPGSALKETVLNLAKDPSGKLLKAYTVLGWSATNALIVAMGYGAFMKAVGELEPAALQSMMAKCASPAQFARLCSAYGGATQFKAALDGVDHANELEAQGPSEEAEPEPEPEPEPETEPQPEEPVPAPEAPSGGEQPAGSSEQPDHESSSPEAEQEEAPV